MAQKALGRVFNWQPACDAVWISVQDAGGIAFGCFLTGGVGDTYTIQEAKDAAGTGAQNLLSVGEFYTNTGNASDAWVRRAPSAVQQAAGTIVTAAAATQNAAVFEVQGTSLSDGYKFVKVTSTGAGAVTALTRDLMTQRDPSNLPALGV